VVEPLEVRRFWSVVVIVIVPGPVTPRKSVNANRPNLITITISASSSSLDQGSHVATD
jgi:hypothetical protein